MRILFMEAPGMKKRWLCVCLLLAVVLIPSLPYMFRNCLFNNDTNKAFVKDLCEMYQKGYFTTQMLYGSYTSSLFVENVPYRPSAYI